MLNIQTEAVNYHLDIAVESPLQIFCSTRVLPIVEINKIIDRNETRSWKTENIMLAIFFIFTWLSIWGPRLGVVASVTFCSIDDALIVGGTAETSLPFSELQTMLQMS